MSLCFLEGEEVGNGILLGRKPRKWPMDDELGGMEVDDDL